MQSLFDYSRHSAAGRQVTAPRTRASTTDTVVPPAVPTPTRNIAISETQSQQYRPRPSESNDRRVIDDDIWNNDPDVLNDPDSQFPQLPRPPTSPSAAISAADSAPSIPAPSVPMRPSGQWAGGITATSWVCGRCTLRNTALAEKCTACGGRAPLHSAISLPFDTLSGTSWRSRAAETTTVDVTRPARARLQLQPRTVAANISAISSAQGTNIFGSARPREDTLDSRGVDWRSSDAELSRRINATSLSAAVTGAAFGGMCPYSSTALYEGRRLGSAWLSKIEGQLTALLSSRNTSLDFGPMPPKRRAFLHDYLRGHWQLQTSSCDPHPHRFVRVTKCAGSCIPELLLSRALVIFGNLAAAASTMDECSTFHGVAIWGLVPKAGGRQSNVAGLLHTALTDIVRRSSYELRFVSDKDVIVEFAAAATARKTFSTLLRCNQDLGNVSFGCIQWWPSGVQWAKTQVAFLQRERHGMKAKEREQRRYEAEMRKVDDERSSIQRQGLGATGWDDDSDMPPKLCTTGRVTSNSQHAVQQLQRSPSVVTNAFNVLYSDDDDSD